MTELIFVGGALSADQTSVLITGTDTPDDVGLQIQILDNSVQVATAKVDSSGDWTATVPTSASGSDVYTAQATVNGQLSPPMYGLVVLRSASGSFDGPNPIAYLTGSGDTLSIASPNAIVTAGGNGQNATTTDLIQQFYTPAHVYRTNPSTLSVLDNSRVDVWMDFFTATLGNDDNYGVAGMGESVVVNGAGDNVWIATTEADSITFVNGWNSTGLQVTLLDKDRANVDGNAISIALGNGANCGVYGTNDIVTPIGSSDNIWIGGNGPNAATTDFVNAAGATGLVVNVLGNSRVDVTGDGVTANLDNSSDNFGIYGSAETVIVAPTSPYASNTNINLWIGGNGQVAAVTDQAYVGPEYPLEVNVTALDNSRVDVSGSNVTATVGSNDNFGTYGQGEAVVATGTGDDIWIGGTGPNATAADTVTLQQGGTVIVLDSSWVEVSGAGAFVQMGASDTLTLGSEGTAVTFGATIGQATLAGFDTSDQVTLQKSSFGSQAAGFDYWAYLMGHATAAGGDTTITLDANDSIVLKGVTLSAANQSQFHFA